MILNGYQLQSSEEMEVEVKHLAVLYQGQPFQMLEDEDKLADMLEERHEENMEEYSMSSQTWRLSHLSIVGIMRRIRSI